MIFGRNKHTHLKEPTGVVLFEDLQTELHHPCGLTELHGAVGDLVSHHLRIRFKKKLLGQRANEDPGVWGGWSEGGGCTSYFYLFMEMEGSLPDRVLLCSAFVQTKARQQPQLYFNFLPVHPLPPPGDLPSPPSHTRMKRFFITFLMLVKMKSAAAKIGTCRGKLPGLRQDGFRDLQRDEVFDAAGHLTKGHSNATR